MTTMEECDLGGWYWIAQTKDGYVTDSDYHSGFDPDPKTNSALLMGCTSSCTIETDFKCPDP